MTTTEILNRIDNPTQCSEIIGEEIGGYVFCEETEHNPFTNRCKAHG